MKKLTKLFLLSGLFLLTGSTANAAIVDGVRQKPEPTPTQAWVLSTDTTTTYYLYNVGAKAFFTEGNAWGTQVSVGNTGLKVAFTVPTVNDVPTYVDVPGIPEGVYLLNDYSLAKKAWKLVFFDSETAMFVDRGSQANFGWGVTPIPATNNFRIHVATESEISPTYNSVGYPQVYVGLDVTENAGNTALSPFLEEGEGHYIDWTFVTAEVYEAYLQAIPLYNKAQELKAVIDDAKAQGVNVAAQETVYLNESATMQQLEAAITAVKTAVATNASVATPIDMTSSISNPNFDNASYTGWWGTAPNMVGSGSHGPANMAEHYDKTFDTYQGLSGMPTGVYMLSNNGFLRGWWDDAVNHTNYNAYLYAIADGELWQVAMANPWDIKNTESMAGETEFGTYASESVEDREGGPYYAPNDPSAARLYFEKGYYQNKVFFALENSYMELGVRKSVNRGSEWACFDNFKLTYYGNSAAAYQYWVSQTPKTDYTGAVVSEQYLNAYNAGFQATASNKAEAKATMAVIQAASDNIAINRQLWAALQAKYAEAETKVYENQTLFSAGDLSDYLNDGYYNDDQDDIVPYDILEAEEKTGDSDLSNEELQTVINKIQELMDAVDKEAKEGMQPGTDVTEFITNPGFEDGTTGWTIVSKGGGNVQLGGNYGNHCYEAWHSTNFNVYQEVSDLPVGVYEISVNGYVRYLDGPDAITHSEEAPTDVPIYLYMNDSKANFVSWLSYPKPASFYDAVDGATYLTGDEGSYPDNMIAAAAAFLDGGYLQSAKCLVSEAGAVTRIGVMGTPEAKFWPIFDNFQLTYLGMALDVVKPLLEEKVAEANDLANEMTTKDAKAALTTALTDANAALAGEDGQAIFACISKLEKAISDLKEGRTLCQNFQETVQEFMAYASESDSPLASDALTLGGTIQSELEACELDEAAIEAYKLTMREYRLKMELPADYAQGSEEGVDVTAFIQTPNFEKVVDGNPTNSIDGWIGSAGYNFGNDDTQRGALAIEFYQKAFDMYQNLGGVGTVTLPKGNYRLQVNAFERVSEYTPAYLYAIAGNDTLNSVELKKHEDGFNGREGESGPGDMVSAKQFFEEGRYVNSIDFYSDGETIRIGIIHESYSTYDWIIMDDFQLFYYGDNGAPVVPENNMLYVADGLRLSKSATTMLPISMKNEDEIVGLQLDVVLPEGLSFAKNNKGKYIVTKNEDRSDSHSLSSNILPDGSIRIVCTSMENEVIYGNDGVMLNLGIDVESWLPNGDYAIQLKNVKLTNANKQTLTCSDKTFMVKVGGKKGDVNGDDEIDVTDAVLIIDHILAKNPANFDASVADVNADGDIDVTDVVMVIDAILGKIQLSRTANFEEVADKSAYTAFQIDLAIPAGYVLEGVTLADIAKKRHSLAYNMLPNGRCRVVVCSMNNEALPGAWDEVIRLNLRGQGNAQVNIDRAVFVTIDGERHELIMNGTTAITEISNLKPQTSNLYDLQGRKVEKAEKGILISNNKKVVVK